MLCLLQQHRSVQSYCMCLTAAYEAAAATQQQCLLLLLQTDTYVVVLYTAAQLVLVLPLLRTSTTSIR
jgi:hypothetical protein